MHIQEDLVPQRGTTGYQQMPQSGAEGSSSLRGSFLALYDVLMTQKGRNGIGRTAVDEKQWDGTLDNTPLVHVMYAQPAEPVHRDGAREHGERVQLALMRAPVVPILPSASEPPDVCERYAVVPLGSVDFVW